MNHNLILTVFTLFFSLSAIAQPKSVMSVQACIDYALTNQHKIKSARIDEELQRQKNNEVMGMALPQITANGQFQYLFIIPKQRADANAFDFGSSLSFFKIDTPAFLAYQQQPKQRYTEIQFGLPFNVSAGVQATQILFDAGVLVALKARKSLEELSVLNTKRTEEEIRVSVSKAYYNCIIAEKRIKLLDENITMLRALESQTNKLFDEGFAERIDADRLTVQRNNLEIEKQKILSLIELSYQILKFQMGMPLQQEISLFDNLTIDEVRNGLELDRVLDYNNRIEMNLLRTAKRLNQYDEERYRKGYLPSIAAVLSGSYATQTKSIPDIFKYSYFPTGAFGLSASVPIYDGNTRKSKLNQTRLNILKNEQDMEALKQAVDFENSNARIQLKNSLLSLDNQKKNIELAERVYTIAQKKFREGVGSNIEIIQAETALKDAQTNFFNTLYEAIIAKIDFQKSLGLLK
jgi:outer membrane protein TolC